MPQLPEATSETPQRRVVGALADVVEEQFARLFDAMGIANVRFLPPRRARELPPVGPSTRYLLAQPFLGETARVLDERGARRVAAPFPLGAEGTTLSLKAAAEAFDVDPMRFRSATAAAEARAKRALEPYRAELSGRSIFFFPDSQLEIPLGRMLSRELGMSLTEVGTPYLHRQHLAEELALLPEDTTLSEGQASPIRWRPRG